jgi:hypothetical protein
MHQIEALAKGFPTVLPNSLQPAEFTAMHSLNASS